MENRQERRGWCECMREEGAPNPLEAGESRGLCLEHRLLLRLAERTPGDSRLLSCAAHGADHWPSSACLAASLPLPSPTPREPLSLGLAPHSHCHVCLSCLCLTFPASPRSPALSAPSSPHWVWYPSFGLGLWKALPSGGAAFFLRDEPARARLLSEHH